MLAVGEHMLGGLSPECTRMATGFAGGVGSTQQELCGALSGGVLVISGLLGRTDSTQSDQLALDLVADYRRRFLAELGATQCARLRETAVHGPDGLGSCAVLVERAAGILLVLLSEAPLDTSQLKRRLRAPTVDDKA